MVKCKGDIHCNTSVIALRGIQSCGSIYAKFEVNSNRDINAKGSIEAGHRIVAGGSILAGESIKSDISIYAQNRIEAGNEISSGWVFSFFYKIKCPVLKSTKLPFSKEFWMSYQPFIDYYQNIKDSEKCYDDYAKLGDNTEKANVLADENLNWIIKAQLSNFFGFTNGYLPTLKEQMYAED